MQFIEKNSLDLRSAVYRLKHDDARIEFVLFPMIHIGTREYYREVSARLAKCDVILTEGVRSKHANALTRGYRFAVKIKRLDLVTQSEAMDVAAFRSKLKHSDMSGREFDGHWRNFHSKHASHICFSRPFISRSYSFPARENRLQSF